MSTGENEVIVLINSVLRANRILGETDYILKGQPGLPNAISLQRKSTKEVRLPMFSEDELLEIGKALVDSGLFEWQLGYENEAKPFGESKYAAIHLQVDIDTLDLEDADNLDAEITYIFTIDGEDGYIDVQTF